MFGLIRVPCSWMHTYPYVVQHSSMHSRIECHRNWSVDAPGVLLDAHPPAHDDCFQEDEPDYIVSELEKIMEEAGFMEELRDADGLFQEFLNHSKVDEGSPF